MPLGFPLVFCGMLFCGLCGFHSDVCASGIGPMSVGAVPARLGIDRLDGCARRIHAAKVRPRSRHARAVISKQS